MNKLLPMLFLGAFCLSVKAQTPDATIPTTQPFGKIDNADLELKTCDFEKDANAEVLFNSGSVYYDSYLNLVGEYHKRIKIFNVTRKMQRI